MSGAAPLSHDRARPASVILDLLRSARSRHYSAGALIDACGLFGFSENTVRVTLSRLIARGTIESPKRGSYRLSPRSDALNDFVERWRLGEDRVRPWDGQHWLFCHAAAAAPPARWALAALGFGNLEGGLWVRPDNLRLTLEQLRAVAAGIGLDAGALLLVGRPEEPDPAPLWAPLWSPETLSRSYADALARLRASAARLPALPVDEARLECFRLGGEVIHRLAKDPLLPAQMIDCTARRDLSRAMLDYDVLGKQIWARSGEHALHHMPRPQLARVE